MKAAVVLASVALFLVFQHGNASSCNGNLVCEPGEDRAVCPSDCCLRVKNGVCSFYPDCARQDPDCCESGCASSYQACLGNDRQSCYPGKCAGGTCSLACSSYLECSSGYCSSSNCAQRAAQNGVLADGGWSCANCFSAGVCAPCSACLSISSQGYAVYKGDAATIYYDISNRCGSPLSPVSLFLSGPLMRHSSLSAQSIQTLSNFETKRFSVTVSYLPAVAYGAYALGEYELKVGAASKGGQQASYVSTVFVLPSLVFSSGMEIPPNRIVGHSVREALMRQGLQLIPVELEVWAW